MKYCYCRDMMNVDASALFLLFAVTYGLLVKAQNCPHGWLDRPGSATCYSFRFKQKKSWVDARLECQRYDGELLKIETDKEKVWVLSQVHHIENDEWWTGLNNREQGDVTKWFWADGVALEPNLLKWAPGEPNNYLGQEHCAEIWQGNFNDTNCDQQLYYICERSKRAPLSCDVDDGWERLGGNCYKFMPINRNYEDATYACTQYDASLVDIFNEDMQQLVTDLAKHYGRNSWLGLQVVHDWNGNMVLEWTNGSSPVKTWWSGSKTSNHTLSNTSSCVILNVTKNDLHNWEYADCTEGSSFICTKQSDLCSDGWVQRQRHCYFFFSQKTMSWKDSVAFCNLRRAMLIQMNRDDNIEFLSTELQESFGQDVDSMWIGISGKDGTWSQLSGDAANVTSSMWAENVMQTDTNASTKCAYILRDDRDLKWHISADCSIERGVICTASSNVPVKPPPLVFPEPKCIENWLASLPNCFRVNTEPVTWFEARMRCQQEGGDLAVIANEQDQKLLSSEIQQEVWIGLNDREQENKYVWLDRNDQASLTYWRRGEPDNKIIGNMYTENCIAMGFNIGTQDHGKWIDYPCAFKLGFVCQRMAVRNIAVGKTARQSSLYLMHMANFAVDNKISYNLTDNIMCSHTIKELNPWWEVDLGTHYNIGSVIIHHRMNNELCLHGQQNLRILLKNGTLETGIKIVHDQPCLSNAVITVEVPPSISARYVRIDIPPNQMGYLALCEVEVLEAIPGQHLQSTTTVKEIGPSNSTGCGGSWIRSLETGQCYQKGIDKLTWTDAREACRSWKATLVSLQSPQEGLFLAGIAQNEENLWIGVSALPADHPAWHTVDRKTVSFSDWGTVQRGAYCALNSIPRRTWQAVICQRRESYICIKRDETALACSEGWIADSAIKTCYTLEKALRNWHEAESACKTRNSHLVSLNSMTEYIFVTALKEQFLIDDFWIGLHDSLVEGNWTWSDGSSFLFKKWAPNEPNYYNGSEDCGVIQSNKLMNDLPCTEYLMSVCERPAFLSPTCDKGWELDPNTRICFKFGNEKKTWNEARAACQKLGGDLAAVKSPDEQMYIYNRVHRITGSRGCWIGAFDTSTENIWKGVDGSQITYTDWGQEEPNKLYAVENCASIHLDLSPNQGKWNDQNCTLMFPYICQRSVSELIPSSRATTTSTLPTTTNQVETAEDEDYADYDHEDYTVYDHEDDTDYDQLPSTSCGGSLTGNTGNFTSPGYPNEYPHGVNCSWLITVSPGLVIRLTFNTFSMESDFSCDYDYVEVYNNSIVVPSSKMGRYCDFAYPPVLTSMTNVMVVLFVSDSSDAHEGFSASYVALNASTLCGSLLTALTGVITSPNFPNNYPHQSECVWIIVAPSKNKILITFTDFEIETNPNCTYDYLEIRNGKFASSPLIGTYCGTNIDKIIVSHSNHMYLKFKTDNTRSARGFRLSYDSTGNGCGEDFSTATGSFISPNYPKLNGHNAECFWRIQVSRGSTIRLDFMDLDMETHSNCSYDYVEVRETNAFGRLLGKFCGTSVPDPISSTTNQMWVKYRTDSSVAGRGFHALYTTNCNNRLTSYSGVIESPNFPNSYPFNRNCTWIINTLLGNTINVSFSHFDIKTHTSCQYDHLEVRDGENENGNLIGNFCGSSLPPPISSSGDVMWIQFISDHSFAQNGFRLEYITNGCGGYLTGATGEFTSPNYPNPYPHRRECVWMITVSTGSYIQVTITDFDLESHSECKYNALEVFGGPDNMAPRLARLCHTQTSPQVLTSTGNMLFVRFRSDFSSSGKGFRALYKALSGGCGGNFTTPTGTIMSRNYPNNYPHNTDCEWLITMPERRNVYLTFEDFDLEGFGDCRLDYVSVYDGPIINSMELMHHCGNSLPDPSIYQTNSNTMYIRMRSDGSVAARGFKASYKIGCGGIMNAEVEGEISSTNYPGIYDMSSNCSWLIQVDHSNERITLTFTHMDIEKAEDCGHDYVAVMDGNDERAPLIGTYCGNAVPLPVTSQGSALYVKFVSDFSIQRTGFRAVYTKSTSTMAWKSPCGYLMEPIHFEDFCYDINDFLTTWQDARTRCQRDGGDLLSITSKNEQLYIEGRLKSRMLGYYWIGANDQGTEGGWKWSNGDPYIYFNWNSGEPNNAGRGDDCAAIMAHISYKWNDVSCNRHYGYICKKKTIQTTSMPIPSKKPTNNSETGLLGCYQNWLEYDSSCYLFVQNRTNWDIALQSCRQKGGDLASFANQGQQNFIFSQMPKGYIKSTKHTCFFLGLCDDNHLRRSFPWSNRVQSSNIIRTYEHGGFWIGMSMRDRKTAKLFQWSDNSKVTFTTWSENEPNTFNDKERVCVTISQQTGLWADKDCSSDMLGYICKMERISQNSTSLSPVVRGCSYENSIGYASSCYQFVSNPKSWNNAQEYCVKEGGNLAVIMDSHTQAFLSSEMVSKYLNYWIGLRKTNDTRLYQWINGGAVTYTSWNKDFTGNEDTSCVSVRALKPYGLWETENCSVSLPYICQMPWFGSTLSSRLTTSVTTTEAPCPSGWTPHDSFCYMISSNEETWFEARTSCLRQGADLTSIMNDAESTFLKTLLRLTRHINIWLGLNILDEDKGYTWSDGSALAYTQWSKDEPNDLNGNEKCVKCYRYNMLWNDNNCYKSIGFICKKARGVDALATEVMETTTEPVSCGTDLPWKYYNDYCYYTSSSSAEKTWRSAQTFCVGKGAELASIHSKMENNMIFSVVSRLDSKAWIGLSEFGLDDLSQTNYVWSDKTAVNFFNWALHEPDDANFKATCVAMDSGGGVWYDEKCGIKLPFVCKRRYSKVTPLPTAPTQVAVGGCPPDFLIFGSKCFLIRSTARYDFDTARNTCIQYGTGFNLASINSQLEQMFLVLYMRETGGSSAFIGLNDLQEDGQYDWLDNSPVNYINFRAGQPSLPARENCVEIFSNGTWNNLNCGSLRGFICQGPRDKNLTEPTPTIPSSHCPADYTVYPITEQCYRILNSSQSWNVSLTLCQADGATLATISDLYDMYFLELLSNAKAPSEVSLWIGLTDFKGTGVFQWISGATVTYTKWDYGEPRLQENMCVAIHKGVWKQVSCDSSQPAICQTVRESTAFSRSTTISTEQVDCRNSSVAFGTKCYLVVLDMPVDWFTAKDMCRDNGMIIASIHSLQESEFIKNLMLSRYHDSPVKSVWIGLLQNPKQWFIWTDNTPINFFNWDDKEPNMNNETLACTELSALTGSWYDDDCSARKGFVCKGDPALLVGTIESSTMITVTGPTQLYDGSNTENAGMTLAPGQIAGIIVGIIGAFVILGVCLYVYQHGKYRVFLAILQRSYTPVSVLGNTDHESLIVEMHSTSVGYDQ